MISSILSIIVASVIMMKAPASTYDGFPIWNSTSIDLINLRWTSVSYKNNINPNKYFIVVDNVLEDNKGNTVTFITCFANTRYEKKNRKSNYVFHTYDVYKRNKDRDKTDDILNSRYSFRVYTINGTKFYGTKAYDGRYFTKTDRYFRLYACSPKGANYILG